MNEQGLAKLAAGDAMAALDAFTEAVRLWPAAAAYHSNRAAVALRVGRFADAEESATAAVERDGANGRAWRRLGQARLELGRCQEAAEAFRTAIRLAKTGTSAHAVAVRGLESALELARAEERAAERGQLLSTARRPPEQAAAELEAARAVAARQPGLRVGHAASAAALIALGRWHDAAEATRSLPADGEERAYLEAEAAWRGGDVAGALALLARVSNKVQESSSAPQRAAVLRARLDDLRAQMNEIDELAAPEEAIERCTDLLDRLQRLYPGASGLIGGVFVRRGTAHLEVGDTQAALADASCALDAEPGLPAALALRARALGRADRHTDAFLAWRQLAKHCPGWPGLEEETAAAARRCAGQQAAGARQGATSSSGGAVPASCLPTDALAALRLDDAESLDRAAVRAAYRREAARWHPDRWAGSTGEELASVQANFILVQRAYEEAMACLG